MKWYEKLWEAVPDSIKPKWRDAVVGVILYSAIAVVTHIPVVGPWITKLITLFWG